MAASKSTSCLLALAIIFLVSLSGSSVEAYETPKPNHSQAYVSLLYSDQFVVGLRVLGQSLKESGTDRDLVVLVAGNLSTSSYETLANDGWKVHRVEAISNPGRWTQGNTRGRKFPARFWGVYTKLLIFNLTQYERVVYLDADTIALRNLDEMFLCDATICGVMRHSERLNTGVLVIEPSAQLFDDMIDHIAELPSYTGGDQGFVNAFFGEYANSPLFNPFTERKAFSKLYPDWKDAQGRTMARLPTIYNADLGLFVLNSNRWTLPPEQIGVLHYTLASFKPWDWWTSWIIAGSAGAWQELRLRLPESSHGYAHGETGGQYFARLVLVPLPLAIAVLLVRYLLWDQGLGSCLSLRLYKGRGWTLLGSSDSASSGSSSSGAAAAAAGPAFRPSPVGFSIAASIAGVVSLAIGLYITTFHIVPHQIKPMYGWLLAYEWTSLFLAIFFGFYLRFCYNWGVARGAAAGSSSRALTASKPFWCGARPWGETVCLGSMLLLALWLLPWWGDIAHVGSFVTKVLLSAVAGAASFAFSTQAFAALALAWYNCGYLEANSTHRSIALSALKVEA